MPKRSREWEKGRSAKGRSAQNEKRARKRARKSQEKKDWKKGRERFRKKILAGGFSTCTKPIKPYLDSIY